MRNIVYIGNMESDIIHCNKIFSSSITYYGTNKNNNISFCNMHSSRINIRNYSEQRKQFLIKEMCAIIERNQNVAFMFYNQAVAYSLAKMNPSLLKYIKYCNAPELVRVLNDKLYTRSWVSNSIPTLPCAIINGKQCDYHKVTKLLGPHNKFIVQDNNSSGGFGTIVITSKKTLGFPAFNFYSVSKYFENSTSINIHIVIGNNEVIVFPGSIQLIEESDSRLLYKGADFNLFSMLPESIKILSNKYSKKIGELLKMAGYRGICGIDFLLTKEDKLYFLEINPRFQGSSFLLSKMLVENNFKSIYEYSIDAFDEQPNFFVLKDSFSSKFFKLINDKNTTIIKNISAKNQITYFDGYNKHQSVEPDAYMYKILI